MNRRTTVNKEIMAGALRCPTLFYYLFNKPRYRTPVTENQQAIIDKGVEIGMLARQLFPNGTDVTQNGTVTDANLLHHTNEALAKENAVLYEAAFMTPGGLYCRADIVVKQKNTIRLYEVKSATSRKDEYIFDVAAQHHIISKLGFDVEPHLVYVNRSYIRGRELDLIELFKIEDVSNEVEEIHEDIMNSLVKVSQLRALKQMPEPKVGEKCFKPRECPFKEHCWKTNVPEHSIFDIGGIRKTKAEELFHSGIKLITDVKL